MSKYPPAEPFIPPREDGRLREISKPLVDGNGCWVWQGSLASGYGKLRWDGRIQWAHRVYYEVTHGPIPAQRQVHHACGNRACVNPEHLTLLTARDHGRLAPRAKLGIKQIRAIRKKAAEGAGPLELGKEYGVTRQTIGSIVAGRTWQEEVACPHCGHKFDPFD